MICTIPITLTAAAPPTLGAAFLALDWLVLIGYFAILAGTGWYFACRETKNTEDYFLGGRRIPAWAAAVSILATGLSAATFVGGPQQSFVGDLTYLSTNIGMVIAAVVLAVFFIPALYRSKVATVYQLLDTRFGPGAKQAASAAFMVGRVFASGARLFIVGLPAALIIFGEPAAGPQPEWQLLAAIGTLTAVAILYTLVGGIASVIWSDVIQTGVFMLAVGGAIVLLFAAIDAPFHDLVDAWSNPPPLPTGEPTPSKLTAISTSFDPAASFTLWTSIVGFALLGIASYGTDQDLVQRMLTCKNAASGARAAIGGILIGIPAVATFLAVGLLLYIFYQRPDLVGIAAPDYEINDSRSVFLNFILREMPPGMSGLMMAGLFAAGLSSTNSAINAMSSTFVGDFYEKLRPNRDPRHYLLVGRLMVVAFGLVLGAFACFCVFWQRDSGQTLIDFALSVMTFAYAGLLGVYFTALFTKRGSTPSVLLSLAVGFVAILIMRGEVMPLWAPLVGIPDSFSLAFPWQLTIATTLSFITCVSFPAPKPGPGTEP